MINFFKKKSSFIRFLTVIGLILPVVLPVKSWVLAQNEVRTFSTAHVISTSEFGIENPEGMAYFPHSNSFIIWEKNSGGIATLLHNESTRKVKLSQSVENSLGTAFEPRSNSLFTLSAGNTQLIKSGVESKSPVIGFNVKSLDLKDIQGMTFDPATGRLLILEASRAEVLVVLPHPVDGFNGITATGNQISRVGLESISRSRLRGVALNPNNGHLYIGSPDERKVYELTETGEWISTYDMSSLQFENPSTMLFAPSQDTTDDPGIMALYILDSGQPIQTNSSLQTDQRNASQKGQIAELSLQAPAALPSGTPLLPATLVRTFDTSNQSWNPSSPDPAGIDYWPLTNQLLIADSEVDEMRAYFQGKNVFLSTTSGTLTGTCTTTSFTGEPTGVAINPNNNHIFFSTDFNDSVFEVGLGPDGLYCTADDTLTVTNVANLYRISDAEDVAYGNNTLFIGGGGSAEVYRIPLGPNGILGGGDDGAMTHFDTASLGFSDVEALGYNSNSDTLFVASPKPSDRYLGEFTTSGVLLRAYDLSLMGTAGNIRSDVTYAPGSQNPAVKNIYIASRGVDNDNNRNENDGKVWEIHLSGGVVPTGVIPTATPVTPTPTVTSVPPVLANIQVNIGGNNVGNYQIPPQGSQLLAFPGENNGPAQVVSTNSITNVTSLQTIWKEPGFRSSYSEMMGLPKEQLSTEYWFPWYNNLDTASMDQGFRIASVNASGANTIEVWAGGLLQESFSLAQGASVRVGYQVNNGPARVVCTTCTGDEKIIAALRVIWQEPGYRSSYSELMGLPKEHLSTEYWFPWYNNATVSMDQGLRIANLDNALSHMIQVWVGPTQLDSFSLGAGASIRKSYAVDNGPLRVVCTSCTGSEKIIAALRVIWQEPGYRSSYSELMGLPKEHLSTEYWFPWYNNATVSMDQGLRIANLDTTFHTIKVFIGATQLGTDINLPAGASTRVAYIANTGPIHIVCTSCSPDSGNDRIIAALRVIWQEPGYRSSYSEMLGLPKEQLSTEYWFPWYNNGTASMDQAFRISVP